jgi:hypothetical protein
VHRLAGEEREDERANLTSPDGRTAAPPPEEFAQCEREAVAAVPRVVSHLPPKLITQLAPRIAVMTSGRLPWM